MIFHLLQVQVVVPRVSFCLLTLRVLQTDVPHVKSRVRVERARVMPVIGKRIKKAIAAMISPVVLIQMLLVLQGVIFKQYIYQRRNLRLPVADTVYSALRFCFM